MKKKARTIDKTNKIIVCVLVFGLLALASLFIYSVSRSLLPVMGEPGHVTGSFSFTDQDGRTVTDKDVDGKIRVAEYFFTSCKGICPVMNNNLKIVQDAFKNRDDVMILSHTVNPEMDSCAELKAYAKRMHAIPGKWEFLTGDKLKLYEMAERDYLLSADTVNSGNIDDAFIHTQYIALVDKQNRIRGFYDAVDVASVNRLIHDIKEL